MKLGFKFLVATLVWGLGVALVQAAGSQVLFTIPENDLYPESVAYDTRTGDYFVSSMGHSRILRAHADGSYEDFVRGPAPGLESSIGMKADAGRRRLWVCSGRYTLFDGAGETPARTGVLLFDLDRGTLIKKWLVDQPSPAHIFNDVVVAADGDVYVTTTLFGKVYRISAGSDAMEVILDTVHRVEVLVDSSADLAYPTTGVVVDDAFVFVATSYADVPRNPASVSQHDDVVIRTVSLRGESDAARP